MAKMSELDAALTELSTQAKAMLDTVQYIRTLLSPAAADEAAEQAPKKKPFTLEEVRAALLQKRKEGYGSEVKALLIAHGAEKLTEIDPGQYDSLMADAEAIGQ